VNKGLELGYLRLGHKLKKR